MADFSRTKVPDGIELKPQSTTAEQKVIWPFVRARVQCGESQIVNGHDKLCIHSFSAAFSL